MQYYTIQYQTNKQKPSSQPRKYIFKKETQILTNVKKVFQTWEIILRAPKRVYRSAVRLLKVLQ